MKHLSTRQAPMVDKANDRASLSTKMALWVDNRRRRRVLSTEGAVSVDETEEQASGRICRARILQLSKGLLTLQHFLH